VRKLNVVLLLAAIGFSLGVTAGWASKEFRYYLEQDPVTGQYAERKMLPVVREQEFCLFASVEYRHGEMIYQPGLKITQIYVIDETARWVTVKRGE
jgi:hypothetical protein